jgi:hypothetical protein
MEGGEIDFKKMIFFEGKKFQIKVQRVHNPKIHNNVVTRMKTRIIGMSTCP